MPTDHIDVLAKDNGVVLLGPDVTCDGHHADRDIRVQTHAHTDHTKGFHTSLNKEVVLTRGTRLLLGAAEYPTIHHRVRTNVHEVAYGEIFKMKGLEIELCRSNHMLGSAQVKVTLPDGTTLGYSSDFGCVDEAIKVDQLVLDAESGDPVLGEHADREEIQDRLLEVTRENLLKGPIHILADAGVMEHAIDSLINGGAIKNGHPVIATPKIAAFFDVYRTESMYSLPKPLIDTTDKATAAMKNGRPYVRLWSLGATTVQDGLLSGTVIRLTRLGTTPKEPVTYNRDNGTYTVAFSHHASFEETLEYVKNTGAQLVVTDGIRGGARTDRATTLAQHIKQHLHINAYRSSNRASKSWGG